MVAKKSFHFKAHATEGLFSVLRNGSIKQQSFFEASSSPVSAISPPDTRSQIIACLPGLYFYDRVESLHSISVHTFTAAMQQRQEMTCAARQ